jgi:hypothetical protein
MVADRTARKQRGVPFPPGKSGNAAGRPRGARNRATLLADALSDADAAAIVDAVVTKAKRGDMVAARLVLDRLWPKGRTVALELPPATDAKTVMQAHSTLLRSLAAASVTPEEAETVSRVLTAQLRAIETADIDQRLAELEARTATK